MEDKKASVDNQSDNLTGKNTNVHTHESDEDLNEELRDSIFELGESRKQSWKSQRAPQVREEQRRS